MKFGYDVFLSERVRELLDEGTISEIIKLVDQDLRDSWAATPPEATVLREQIYQQIHSLSLLHTKMETLVQNLRYPELGET